MSDTADTSVRGWLAAICARFHPAHDQEPTMSTVTAPRGTREEVAEVAGEAVEVLVKRGWTEEDSIELVIDLLDAIVALPEPGESASDVAIEAAVPELFELLRRDPVRMRARAAKLKDAGKDPRASRLLERAGRVEARQG